MEIKNGIVERVNLITALLDAERTNKPVTFYTRKRQFLDRYRCIDTDLKPFTLKKFVTHGELVYYKTDRFNWKTISIDDITRIEL